MTTTKKTRTIPATIYEQVHESARTALYFGFIPEKIKSTEDDIRHAKALDKKEEHEIEAELAPIDFKTEDKVTLIRIANERGAQGGQPLMTYRESETRNQLFIHLDIIGNSKAVSEALIIGAARSILNDAGIDTTVVVNCIGDKDSTQRFTKALTEYYRLHLNTLPPECRQLIKKDVFSVTLCARDSCAVIAEESPRSMNFLSEPSRVHFKEVLEYMDLSNIPYIIDDTLLPGKSYASHTVFKLIESTTNKNPTVYAYGARYNTLSKRIGGKRELGAVGITIAINKKEIGEIKKKIKIPASPFFFIHVGTEARLRSIGILELLRQEKLPLEHSIIKDKLSGQLAQAEERRAPYVLLMGQRECIDESVIIRNTENRSQKSVKIADLPQTLKKLL